MEKFVSKQTHAGCISLARLTHNQFNIAFEIHWYRKHLWALSIVVARKIVNVNERKNQHVYS